MRLLARTRWAVQWPERQTFRGDAWNYTRARAAREAVHKVPFLTWALSAGFAFPPHALELLSLCESPAEAFLVREFASREGVHCHTNMAAWNGCLLAVQHPVSNYRVDLTLTRGGRMLAIEADGMRFHGGQRDFERDCLRQRRLTYAGYTVLRFTAREAMNNPVECWRQNDRILLRRSTREAKGPPTSKVGGPLGSRIA